MDWTSVFDESGEEDLIISHLSEPNNAPRLERLILRDYICIIEDGEERSAAAEHRLWELAETHHFSPTYTLKALYYLSINYILGVGILGVPYAFARAGFILCSVILITVSTLSYITVMWVAETGVRLERHHSLPPSCDDGGGCGIAKEEEIGATSIDTEKTPLRKRTSSVSNGVDVDVDRYEVIDLVSFYLGNVHKLLYQISLIALMFVGLLAYTQVFCGAIDALMWSSSRNSSMQGLPQLIFGLIVVPLSCVELDEQVEVQSFMAAVRIVAIFIMVGGSVLALSVDNSDENRGQEYPPYFAPAEPENCRMSYTACFSGFGVAFSTALFSQLFQHSVPGLLRPLREQTDKIRKVPRVFAASLLTTCSFYLLLGTTAASYFGADTRSSVNLNFANFTYGLDESTAPRAVLLLLRFASNLVVMFPAIDTLSVFPLIANTLGSNLMASTLSKKKNKEFLKWIARHIPAYRRIVMQSGGGRSSNRRSTATVRSSPSRQQEQHLSTEERKELTKDATKVAIIFWRLVAAIPPLVGSIWATDLSFSLLLAGVAGIYVAFLAPALLQLASCRLEKRCGGAGRGGRHAARATATTTTTTTTTVFTGWYSWTGWAYPIGAFGTFSMGVVLLQIREAWQAAHDR